MSDLQKEFLRAKLRNLPLEPPMPLNVPHELSILQEDPDEATEELPQSPLTDDSSSASSASSTGTIRPTAFSRPIQ